jgi:hypothetical protein
VSPDTLGTGPRAACSARRRFSRRALRPGRPVDPIGLRTFTRILSRMCLSRRHESVKDPDFRKN